jgi:hypothetical protein
MHLKTFVILSLTFSSVNCFAQKKKHVRHADRNAVADSYFTYRTPQAQDRREQSRVQNRNKVR